MNLGGLWLRKGAAQCRSVGRPRFSGYVRTRLEEMETIWKCSHRRDASPSTRVDVGMQLITVLGHQLKEPCVSFSKKASNFVL
eukprot:scaffold607_cov109-Cylindrotheca_fusiformis.AAC.3